MKSEEREMGLILVGEVVVSSNMVQCENAVEILRFPTILTLFSLFSLTLFFWRRGDVEI